MKPNFDMLRHRRPPTKKEKALYRKWVKYLKDSKLSDDAIHERAAELAERKIKVP